MALNLKRELLNGNERIVPNCSSDESGSDCSSEELIDCDDIVDVTTVTVQNDEAKPDLQKSTINDTGKNIIDTKSHNTKSTIVKHLKSGHDNSNIKPHILNVSETSIEVTDKSSDKSCSIISRNSDEKQPQTKPTGILRGPDFNIHLRISYLFDD